MRSMEAQEVSATHQPVVRRGMMFCKVVRQVVGAFAPVDYELLLGYAIAYPVKAHVHSF